MREVAKFIAQKTPNDNLLEVTKFVAQKSSNEHHDSMLEISENTAFLKSFIAITISRYHLFSVLQKYLGFAF